jgi:hypothetical protein
LSDFPFQPIKKVSDLIYYDEPILSHYTTAESKNLFLYLIDITDEFSRWLTFGVTEKNLFHYLKGKISLRNLILSSDNEFIYIVNTDDSFKFSNTEQFKPKDTEKHFLPNEDSFLEIDTTEHPDYRKLDRLYKDDFYAESLAKSTYYLKIEPSTDKHAGFVSLNQISSFINLINKSYAGYSEVNFTKKFHQKYTDEKVLNRTLNAIKKPIELLTTSAKAASFEIGLAIDKTMVNSAIEDPALQQWAKEIFMDYKTNVIELDYDDDNTVKRINETYTENQRQKIYKPFFDLINNKEMKVSSGEKGNKLKHFKSVKEERIDKILPKMIEDQPKQFELVKYVVKQEKGKATRHLTERNTLFSETENEELVKFEPFDYSEISNGESIFKKLEFRINLEGELHILSINFAGKDINVSDLDYKNAKQKLINKILLDNPKYLKNK